MKPVSNAAAKVTSKNFSQKFIAMGRIVKSWPEIMGESFATKATPSRLHYTRPKNTRSKPLATLEIATSHADATLMHYQKDVILQRIEHLFGEAWINDIKFIAVERKTLKRAEKKYARPLTQGEKNHLSTILESVSDPEVYKRLESLGEGILKTS